MVTFPTHFLKEGRECGDREKEISNTLKTISHRIKHQTKAPPLRYPKQVLVGFFLGGREKKVQLGATSRDAKGLLQALSS